MKPDFSEDLETLIENEKKALIEEYFRDAWNELAEEGMDPALVAEVFAEAAFKRLSEQRGDKPVSKLLTHLAELDELGFLPSGSTVH